MFFSLHENMHEDEKSEREKKTFIYAKANNNCSIKDTFVIKNMAYYKFVLKKLTKLEKSIIHLLFVAWTERKYFF